MFRITKAIYKELLKDKLWKEKRKLILKRDKYKCRRCAETKSLEVHHRYYIEDKLPWEVPNSALITLCRKHHEMAHVGRTVSSFIKKQVIKKPKIKTRWQTKKKLKKKD